MKTSLILAFALLLPLAVSAQQPLPVEGAGSAQVQMSGAPDLATILAQLEQSAANANIDLGRLRIEKWRTDREQKERSQQNAESIQRNIAAALPAMVSDVRLNPNALAPLFKLYRNVNALYDVLARLAEATGAFGPREDFQALANDAAAIEQVRRDLGQLLETIALARDAQGVQPASAASDAKTGVKKIVIDDNDPPKKRATRKKK